MFSPKLSFLEVVSRRTCELELPDFLSQFAQINFGGKTVMQRI
jgi:hypothetical protein